MNALFKLFDPKAGSGVWRSVHSLGARRYLLAAMVAWILVVYIAGGSGSPAARAPLSAVGPTAVSPTPGSGTSVVGDTSASNPASVIGPPGLTSPVTASTRPASPSPVPLTTGGVSPVTSPFLPPPPVPNNPAAVPSCPLPLPAAATPTVSAGALLNALGPVFELDGPFDLWALPTIGAIAPIMPFVTPLLYVGQPVVSEVDPTLSVLSDDIGVIETDGGLDNPFSQALAVKFEPDYQKLLNSLVPIEKAVAGLPGDGCVLLSEDNLARVSGKLNLDLPPLPQLPSLPAGKNGGSAAGPSPVTAVPVTPPPVTASPVTVVPVSWAGGVTTQVESVVDALLSRGDPVMIELGDVPPAGPSIGGQGFSDFVAGVVHAFPKVSAFQVDVPAGGASSEPELADLVHGLAAADWARQPGQLIGPGVSIAALGGNPSAFWKAFAAMSGGWQRTLASFVGVALDADTPEAAAGQLGQAELQWTGLGGLPSGLPVFATVPGDAVSGPNSILASYRRALAGLDVGALGFQ